MKWLKTSDQLEGESKRTVYIRICIQKSTLISELALKRQTKTHLSFIYILLLENDNLYPKGTC